MTSRSERDPDFEDWLDDMARRNSWGRDFTDEERFQAWRRADERRRFLAECPECPQCGAPMMWELKNGEFINRRPEGYWMRRCWPCNKIFASVRGEWKVWTPKES